MTEEQLQQQIEAGEKVTDTDSVAYRKVFDALKKEPYQLPANFADKVLLQIKSEQTVFTLFNEYVWLGLGLATLFVAALISILLTHFKFSWGSLRFLSGYPGLIVLAIVLVTVIQWLDKKVLRPSDF